jgi:hypothetical protein
VKKVLSKMWPAQHFVRFAARDLIQMSLASPLVPIVWLVIFSQTQIRRFAKPVQRVRFRIHQDPPHAFFATLVLLQA